MGQRVQRRKNQLFPPGREDLDMDLQPSPHPGRDTDVVVLVVLPTLKEVDLCYDGWGAPQEERIDQESDSGICHKRAKPRVERCGIR